MHATGTIIDNDAVPVTVSIEDAAAVAENAGPASFTASLSQVVSSDVVLGLTYAAGTATLADDLGASLMDTVTIDEGNTEATFTVPISDDEIVEGNETFTVTLSLPSENPPRFELSLGNAAATGTITDNDLAEVTLSTDTTTAAENGTFTYTVSLSAAADEAVTVRWTATDGTATVDNDLNEQTGTVTFGANTNTDQEFTIAVNDDDLDEEEETFTVTLEVDTEGNNPLPDGVTIGTDNTATGTITDNDETVVNVTVSIDDESVAENGGNAEFTVSLSQTVTSDVVLAVAYADGTATLTDDLGTRPPTVTINANTTEATLLVPITNDNIVEGNETFTVTLSADPATPLPEGVTIGTDNTATGTITDSDTATVSLSSTAPTPASEGETITFTVELDNPVAEAFSLGWTATNGTATVANDLDEQSGTVEIDANSRTATFDIPVTNDEDPEGSETFTVALTGAATGLVSIAPSRVTVDSTSATGTITASDLPPPTVLSWDIGDGTFVENELSGVITLIATPPVDTRVNFTWSITPGNEDGVVQSVSRNPPAGVIGANQDGTTLVLMLTNDNIVDATEVVHVAVTGATREDGGVVTFDNTGGRNLSVTNDDSTIVSISPTATVAEEGTITFTVNLTAEVTEEFELAWEANDGTGTNAATVADDLEEQAGRVTIPANRRSATFQIETSADTVVEADEVFTVTLTGAALGLTNVDPGSVSIHAANHTATGTITNNDTAEVTLSPAELTAAENETLTYTVNLSAAADEAVTVRWTATAESGDTATVDDDLDEQTGTVTFNANDNTDQTFTIAVTDDDMNEPNETFTVMLTADDDNPLPTGVSIPTATNTHRSTATITDDDEPAPVVVGFRNTTAASVGASEGDNLVFTVELSAEVNQDVVLGFPTRTVGTARSGVDYQAEDGSRTVTIPAGQLNATFAIVSIEDSLPEVNEFFLVDLVQTSAGLPPGVVLGLSNGRGTIVNDDDPITISIQDASAPEGDDIVFTAELSRALDHDLDFLYATFDQTATVADYVPARSPSGRGSVDAGQTSATFTIETTQDSEVEGNETFTEPPRVYRRVFCSNVRRLYRGR